MNSIISRTFRFRFSRAFAAVVLLVIPVFALPATGPDSLAIFFTQAELARIQSGQPMEAVWQKSEIPVQTFLPPEICAKPFDYLSIAKGRVRTPCAAVDIANALLGVSRLKGLQYFSITEKQNKVLIKDCFRISSLGSRSRLRDTVVSEITDIAILFRQEDNRGGDLGYCMRVRKGADGSLIYTAENVEPLVRLRIFRIEPGWDLRYMRIFQHGDTCFYYAAHRLKVPDLAPRKATVKASLLNRLRAFVGFCRSQLEAAAP